VWGVGGDNLRDLFITLTANLVALILVALYGIASAAIVLSIFDWLMGTAYMTAPNVGIGALVALIILRMMR
jgi:hypothetical protein